MSNFIDPHFYSTIKLETIARCSKSSAERMSTCAHQLEHVEKVLRSTKQPMTGRARAMANLAAIDAI